MHIDRAAGRTELRQRSGQVFVEDPTVYVQNHRISQCHPSQRLIATTQATCAIVREGRIYPLT